MGDLQPINVARSPFEGVPMVDVPAVARVSPVVQSAQFVLRADARTARSLTIALGLPLPPSINHFEMSANRSAVMQLGPDEWVLMLADSTGEAITEKAEKLAASDGLLFGLVDISHRMAALDMTGPGIEDVLSAGCPLPLDLARFPVGRATRTIFHKVEILLWRIAGDQFRVACNRSFVSYLTHHLRDVIEAEAALLGR